jgi:hypothetical protein
MRIDRTTPDGAAVFHGFFRTWLLPVQLRYGARVVGRWETEDDRAAKAFVPSLGPRASLGLVLGSGH